MIETLSGSTHGELSNEYQHDRFKAGFQKILRSCALEESRLSIGRLKRHTPYTVYRVNIAHVK